MECHVGTASAALSLQHLSHFFTSQLAEPRFIWLDLGLASVLADESPTNQSVFLAHQEQEKEESYLGGRDH